MDRSRELFCRARDQSGSHADRPQPATQVWLWGQGHAPNLPKFKERFGVEKGCMITGVDLLRGLAGAARLGDSSMFPA